MKYKKPNHKKFYLLRVWTLLAILLLLVSFTGCSKRAVGINTTHDPSLSNSQSLNSDSSNSYSISLDIKDGGIYKIKNKATGRTLNMQMSGMVNGSTVQQYAETDMLDELWRVKQMGEFYILESLFTPRVMAVRKDSEEIGSKIEVRLSNDNENTTNRWTLVQHADSIQIISAKSGLTLGLPEKSIKSSVLPSLLAFEKEDWQLWQFEEVSLQEDLPYILPVDGDLFHSSCPEIIKYEDTYYMYIMAPHISMKASKDLINWETVGTAFKGSDPAWLSEEVPGYGIWAPGVYKIKDKYYLYYCISTAGSQNSAIGLAENVTLDHTSPDFKWVDKGMVIRSFTGDEYNCIDPNIITDEKGDTWLTFGSYWNGIYQRQIDPDTGYLLESNPEPYHIAKRFANNGAIEAPYIIKREEYYYLFTAFNPMNNSYHNRVGRSTSAHGPFVDREGKLMLEGGGTPVTQGLPELMMPGHASVFLDDDGQYYFISEYFRKDSPSILLIGTIIWDEDGWPITALTPDITSLLAK